MNTVTESVRPTTGHDEIVIRRARLDDWPKMVESIKKAYPTRWQYKVPERWEWEFVDNPHLDGDELPIWVAVSNDGAVAGQNGAMVERIKLGRREYSLSWSVDTFVLPEHRRHGIGMKLQHENGQAHDVFMSIGMTAANRRVKARFGSVELAPIDVFSRVYRVDRDSVAQSVRRSAPRAVAGGIRRLGIDGVAAWMLNASRRRPSPVEALAATDVQISEVDRFPDEADAFCEVVESHFDAVVHRSAEHLNWKFARQPYMHHRRWIARRRGEVCGLLVTRLARPPEKHIGIIVELLAEPDDADSVRALLAHAVNVFEAERVLRINSATTVPQYKACLTQFGFQLSGTAVPSVYCKDESVLAYAASPDTRWFLGKGDHDWDQYPLG